MLAKFIEIIRQEEKLIEELITLGARQQTALITFDTITLEIVTAQQEKITGILKDTEDKRIKYLTNWLKITMKDAETFKLSKLEKMLKEDNQIIVKNLRIRLKKNLSKLYYINALNRTLSNRARNNVRGVLSAFTSGTSRVCNVKI